MTTHRFLVTGDVQGVGYRWFVARHSRRLGLHGYAQNLPDGRVEVVVTGELDRIDELADLLKTGPAHARVEAVERTEIMDEPVTSRSFEIM